MTVNKKRLLEKRKKINARRPNFVRQESWRYNRVKKSWRKPKGIDNKMKEKRKGVPAMVSVGYRGPKAVRGLHPSGYLVVHVANIYELDKVDKETEAIIIKHTVGSRKRQTILDTAADLGLKVLNPPARIEEFGEVLEDTMLEEEYELLDEDFELDEDLEKDEESKDDSS